MPEVLGEEVPDAELVRRHRAGDPGAFDEITKRYVRLLGAVGYAVLGDYEQAADAVQDALVKAFSALADLREGEKLRGWLQNVVRTTALDHLRRRRRAPGELSPEASAGLAAGGERPEARAQAGELRGAVLTAVQGLPEQYRDVVVLKYVEDRSYKEISEALGISVETIESRLFRARKLLKEKLGGFV